MDVQFREFNPFNVWLWFELESVPSNAEQQYIDELFNSWFFLGKLGSFNAENLQVQDEGLDISYMRYDSDREPMMALMHNMGEIEYQGTLGRCWFDLGTSDAVALDVLINGMQQLSKDFVPIVRFTIGGEHPDWPIPDEQKMDDFAEFN